MGYNENKGIIPIACEELFDRIIKLRADPKNSIDYEVTISMIEIYNECVQDLFIKPALRQKGGMQIREHPQRGVYIDGKKTATVDSYADIQR